MEQNKRLLNEEELDNVAGGGNGGRWGGLYAFFDKIEPTAATPGVEYWLLLKGYSTYYRGFFKSYDSAKFEFSIEVWRENESTIVRSVKTYSERYGELYCTRIPTSQC